MDLYRKEALQVENLKPLVIMSFNVTFVDTSVTLEVMGNKISFLQYQFVTLNLVSRISKTYLITLISIIHMHDNNFTLVTYPYGQCATQIIIA